MPAAPGCGGGGAAAIGTPGAPAPGATDPMAEGAGAPTADAAAGQKGIGQKPPAQHAAGAHDKTIIQRTRPEDRALATRNLNAVMEMFGDTKYAGLVTKEPGGTHGKLTPDMKAAFAKRYPGLPVPSSVVFAKGGVGKPIGVVYSDKQSIDLGMGGNHQHKVGGTNMQHIWFVPNDLAVAFSDTEGSGSKQANLLVNGPGATK